MSMITSTPCHWDGSHELWDTDAAVHEAVSGLMSHFKDLFDHMLIHINMPFLATRGLGNSQLAGLVTSVALGNPFHLITRAQARWYLKEVQKLVTAMIGVQEAVSDASDFYRSTHNPAGLLGAMMLLARSLSYREADKQIFPLPAFETNSVGCDFFSKNPVNNAIAIAVRSTILKVGPTEVLQLYPEEWHLNPEARSERGNALMELLEDNSLPEYLDLKFGKEYRPLEWNVFKSFAGYLLDTRYHLPSDLNEIHRRLDWRAANTHPDSPRQPKRPDLHSCTIPYTQEAMASEDAADRRCFVCWYDFGPHFSSEAATEPAVKTQCGHVQGAFCLDRQLKEGVHKCALCRQELFGLEHRLTTKGTAAYLELMGLIEDSEKLDDEVDKYILEGCMDTHGPEFGVLLHKLAGIVSFA